MAPISLRFIYSSDVQDKTKEIFIENVCSIVIATASLKLPNYLEIEFVQLEDGVYAETMLDPRFKNRIRLSDRIDDLLEPLLHELIHVSQVTSGHLVTYRNGVHAWKGQMYFLKPLCEMTDEEYLNLPWEKDVENTLPLLLDRILGPYNI